MDEDFIVQIMARLNISGINSDIKAVEDELKKRNIKIKPTVEKAVTKQEVSNLSRELHQALSKIGINIDVGNIKSAINQTLKEVDRLENINLKIKTGSYEAQMENVIASAERWQSKNTELETSIESLRAAYNNLVNAPVDKRIENERTFQQELDRTRNKTSVTKSGFASDEEVERLKRKYADFLANNTKIASKTRNQLLQNQEVLNSGIDIGTSKARQFGLALQKAGTDAQSAGKLGKSAFDKLTGVWQKFGGWTIGTQSLMFMVNKTREAVAELKEVDTYLTEISKTNDKLSKQDLKNIGVEAYGVASKYGKKAGNYLSAMQEASRAGYTDASGMAELSLAVQGAGDVSEETANKYVIATDKAYKLKGEVKALTEVFDGSNEISNHYAVNMQSIADGMSIVGTTAASLGVEADETTAVLGTMAAVTQQEGSEVARAFRAILLNIRQISDEEESIDAEGLTKYEKACNALGVKLKETKNGVLQTRDAMEVLKELSVEYNKLESNDARRTNLLNAVGGKLRATQLDALLRNWDMYESMLDTYADGAGSMAEEAEKSANNWEGSLNKLSNTFTSIVQSFAQSETIITLINALNVALKGLSLILKPVGWGLNLIMGSFDGLVPKLAAVYGGVLLLKKLKIGSMLTRLVGRSNCFSLYKYAHHTVMATLNEFIMIGDYKQGCM